jgi:hypothetical protein
MRLILSSCTRDRCLIALAGPDVIPLLPDEEEAKPRQPKKSKMMPGDNDGLVIHADQGMLAAVAAFSTACTSHLPLWCACVCSAAGR